MDIRSRFELSTEAALARAVRQNPNFAALFSRRAARGQEQQCVGHQLLCCVVRRSAGNKCAKFLCSGDEQPMINSVRLYVCVIWKSISRGNK
jgi:hypothetical protein